MHPGKALQTIQSFRPHGGLRGLEGTVESQLFTGRFGRMFRTLPAADFSDQALAMLAGAMVAEEEEEVTPESKDDAEENQGIDAGFTYLGQFIDHDLTFDPMSSLQKQNDPDELTNFRTPRFDLDSVYGRGPADQPYLYEDDGLTLKLGRRLTGAEAFDPNARDLPRHKSETGARARALIGDPRNDENVIIAQLHAIFLRFHNHLISHLTAKHGTTPSFAEVQRQVRWHYQWVVLHEFLPTIVGEETVHRILPHLRKKTSIYADSPELRFFHWRNQPFMPVEFAVAAYRFGHSMVRPLYRLNLTLVGQGPDKDPVNGRFLIFTPEDGFRGLNGFREFPANWAIDWSLYFNTGNHPPKTGIRRVQKSYKIDTSLVSPLGTLPNSTAPIMRSLAARNLRRGVRMSLPSGQDVARLMDEKVIPDDKLRVGKATEVDTPKNPKLTDLSAEFSDSAPLWYYVLAEAQQQFDGADSTPIRLGPVGGRIVAEVLIGLLLGDGFSFLSQAPGWEPEKAFKVRGKFGMAELIKQAIKA
jgi:hypothetical protein